MTWWPDEGPPLIWQLKLGTGLCMPTIRSGRLFQFDRVGDHARLRCLESETGKLLWAFEYPSEFVDLFGYDNGPCAPRPWSTTRVFILLAPKECCIALEPPMASCCGKWTP